MTITAHELQEILRIFAESNLRTLRVEVGDTRLAVSKNHADGLGGSEVAVPPAVAVPPQASPELADVVGASTESSGVGARATTLAAASTEGLAVVTATTVGVFYRRPSPDKPPYVEIGDVVSAGEPVCTLEVMKMFTEVTASASGRVVQILVDDGHPVEYGQALVVIEPLGSP